MQALRSAIGAAIPGVRDRIAALRKQHGDRVIANITIDQLLGGMRDLPALFCDTSRVPAEQGLLIRGTPIGELSARQPEELFWLMLTGALPSAKELTDLQADLRKRATRVPSSTFRVVDVSSRTAHPMRVLCSAVLQLGEAEATNSSKGGSSFRNGLATTPKDRHWELVLEDCLNLIAALPSIAAYIYRLRFGRATQELHDHRIEPLTAGTWTENFAHQLGFDDPRFTEFLRLYLALQCDHEGGNVSAHTSLLVGSALSDIFYSYSAGMAGLAGPLHGLAAQQCLEWVRAVHTHFDRVPTREELEGYVSGLLEANKVVPGYGHAVLRCVDPRFRCMLDFGEQHCKDDALFQIVKLTYEVAPEVLRQKGRAKNPRPNTDAVPGSILSHFGMPEAEFYTVLFAVSRALGLCAQAVWARALQLPIERPQSLTLLGLEDLCGVTPVEAPAAPVAS